MKNRFRLIDKSELYFRRFAMKKFSLNTYELGEKIFGIETDLARAE